MSLLSAGTGLGIGFQGADAGGKTYAQFQAHIATLAPTSVAWSGSSVNAARRTTAAAATGVMQGSSWGLSETGFLTGAASQISRVVQHGLPSQAVFDAQVASGREIYLLMVDDGTTTSYGAVNRNGYTSAVFSGAATPCSICTDLIYWDGTQAQRMNPKLGTGPTPYVF